MLLYFSARAVSALLADSLFARIHGLFDVGSEWSALTDFHFFSVAWVMMCRLARAVWCSYWFFVPCFGVCFVPCFVDAGRDGDGAGEQGEGQGERG